MTPSEQMREAGGDFDCVACPYCDAPVGEACRTPRNEAARPHLTRIRLARLTPEQRADDTYRRGREHVELWRCPVHGLTTEAHQAQDYANHDEPPFPWVTVCRVSIGGYDTEHCDQPVEGPFWATLNDRRPAPSDPKEGAGA